MDETKIETEVKSTNTNPNSQKQIASAIVLAGLLIAGAILIKDSGVTGAPTVKNPDVREVSIDPRPASTEEHFLGTAQAKITFIEYSDTECPFCKVFHNTMQNLVEGNKDIAWVYRHYPIPQLHPKAFHEAEATECAWEQGGNNAFWKYIDEVFTRTESNNKLDVNELPKIAQDIGLDLTAFNTCLASGKFKDKIEADMRDGSNAGASGTPYSVILTTKEITSKKQAELLKISPKPEYLSFNSKNKNIMGLNGAMPIEILNQMVEILLK